MRALLFALAAVMVAMVAAGAGCRTQPLAYPITDDFGTINTAHDLATSLRDMSVQSGGGCNALATCDNNCVDATCQSNCESSASSDAQTAFTNAVECIYNYCTTPTGKRAARCVQAPDGSFVDPADGGVPGGCNNCITNAYANLGMYSCQPANDPDCNPAQCESLVKMCLAN